MKKKKLSVHRADGPPLTEKRLKRVGEIFEIRQHQKLMDQAYNEVPDGKCAGCTACCLESVNTFFCEFVAISTYMRSHELWTESVLSDILRFYLLELAKPMACPLLMDGKCIIYPVRPLPCRIFGSYEKQAYEADYNEILDENKAISESFKEHYGFALSDELINRKLDFCEKYEVARRISRDEKRALMDQFFSLDAEYMGQRMMREEEWGMSLIAWFGRMAFGREEAIELRVQATKAYLETGTVVWLETIISKAVIAMLESKI